MVKSLLKGLWHLLNTVVSQKNLGLVLMTRYRNYSMSNTDTKLSFCSAHAQ